MTWILEGIVMFVLSVTGLLIDVVTFLFLNSLGLDGIGTLDAFASVLSINIDGITSVFKLFGFFILFMILVFQLWKAFFGPLSDAEDPIKLTAKTVIFCVMVGLSDLIVDQIFIIGTMPFKIFADQTQSNIYKKTGNNIVGKPDGWLDKIGAIPASDNGFTGLFMNLGAKATLSLIDGIVIPLALLLIFLFVMMLIDYIKLVLEFVERYVLLCCMKIFAPLAFACGASQATKNIFTSYLRMIISQVLLMILGIFFINVFITSLLKITVNNGEILGGNVITMILILHAWLVIGQKVDQHLSAMGLDVAQSGGGLGMALYNGYRMASPMLQSARNSGLGNSVANGTGKGARTNGNSLLNRGMGILGGANRKDFGTPNNRFSTNGVLGQKIGKKANDFLDKRADKQTANNGNMASAKQLDKFQNNGSKVTKSGDAAKAISRGSLNSMGLNSALDDKKIAINDAMASTDGLGNLKTSMDCTMGTGDNAKGLNIETSSTPFTDTENGIGHERFDENGNSLGFYRFSGEGAAEAEGFTSDNFSDKDSINDTMAGKDVNSAMSSVYDGDGNEIKSPTEMPDNSPITMDDNGNLSVADGYSVTGQSDYMQDGLKQGEMVEFKNDETGEVSTALFTPQGVSDSSIVGADSQYSVDYSDSLGNDIGGMEVSTFNGASIDDINGEHDIKDFDSAEMNGAYNSSVSDYTPISSNNDASEAAVVDGMLQTSGESGVFKQASQSAFESQPDMALYDEDKNLLTGKKYNKAAESVKEGNTDGLYMQPVSDNCVLSNPVSDKNGNPIRDENGKLQFQSAKGQYTKYSKGDSEMPAYKSKRDIESFKENASGSLAEAKFKGGVTYSFMSGQRARASGLDSKALGYDKKSDRYVFKGGMDKISKPMTQQNSSAKVFKRNNSNKVALAKSTMHNAPAKKITRTNRNNSNRNNPKKASNNSFIKKKGK